MTQTPAPVPDDRRYALWFGALLLDKGHVVALPNGRPELHVRTAKGVKKILLSIRVAAIDPSAQVAVVGRVDDLPDAELPDVVAILVQDLHDPSSFAFVPVASTRQRWVAEGRDYTVPADALVDFDRLDAWLNKHGPAT